MKKKRELSIKMNMNIDGTTFLQRLIDFNDRSQLGIMRIR